MIVFPAIDLKDGAAVRLLRGEMGHATLYNPDPAAQARDFAAAGFAWLHLVDLNGAFEGRAVNAAAVEAILAAVDLPVQLGGGIRDMAAVERWLTAGIRRVILGTETGLSRRLSNLTNRHSNIGVRALDVNFLRSAEGAGDLASYFSLAFDFEWHCCCQWCCGPAKVSPEMNFPGY